MPVLELRLALAAAIATSAMVLYLVALMVAARIWGRFWAMRRANFVDAWQDYLASDKGPVSSRLLSLHPDEMHHLVRGWNLAAEAQRGRPERLARLREIAYACDLGHAAVALAFRGRSRDERVSGLQALGHLGRSEVFDRLRVLVSSRDPLLSLAAWQALLRIDEERALREVGQALCARPEWPEHSVAQSVAALSEQAKSVLIGQAAAFDCTHRIVAALESSHHAGATQLIRHELQTAGDFDDIAQLLYRVQRSEHIELIERALGQADAGANPGPWAAGYRQRALVWRPLDEEAHG
ncbi:MAG: hypothetical protein JJ896_13455 [Rhodothermales bacterium]|nr:hypothetical protein [Rhodothermales bacterium]